MFVFVSPFGYNNYKMYRIHWSAIAISYSPEDSVIGRRTRLIDELHSGNGLIAEMGSYTN